MSRRSCACAAPVEEKSFGAGVPNLEDVRVELPAAAPPSDVPDEFWWRHGARNEPEYLDLCARGALLDLEPWVRMELERCLPVLSGSEGLQLERLLRQYATTKRFRFAAEVMPPWFRQTCETGTLVPYVAGEEVARAAAPPSPPARRPPAAAPPRRPSPRAAAPRRRPPPVPTAVEPDEPDESDVEEEIYDATKLTAADYDPGAPMAEKEAKLLACCRAIGEGKFPGIKDCDVRQDCVLPGGYRLGYHVYLRRQSFGSDPDADQRLLDAGFVRVSARSKAAAADDALRRHGPVLRRAAKRGLGSQATAELAGAVSWLGRKVREASRASDVADNVYLELARELGKLAPKIRVKGARGGRHWAHRLADDARAALEGEDDDDDDDEEEDAQRPPPGRRAKPKKRPHAKTGGADAKTARPSKRTPRRAAVPDESDVHEEIDVMKLTEADYNKPGVSMADKDARLIALLDACREGVFGDELRDCDVPKSCVVAEGYPLGKHLKRRRDTFGSDPDADQKLLDAGLVRVSARSKAAAADDALRRHGPVLRAAAADGLGTKSSTELRKAVGWLQKRVRKVRPSDAAGNVYLELARELGKLAPKGAKGGRGEHGTDVYWAHDLGDRARALLAGEDVAPQVPKKRKRAAAARAKPVKKPSRPRR